MSRTATKLVVVIAAVAAVGVLIALYVGLWATNVPQTIAATPGPSSGLGPTTRLTLQTDAAVGPQESPAHPDWVGYLVRRGGTVGAQHDLPGPGARARARHDLPVRRRIGAAQPVPGEGPGHRRRTSSSSTASRSAASKPKTASHTFVIPQFGVFAPLPGVAEEAKNQCEYGPCDPATMAHRTIEFTFRTGKKGRYRWQCFVPCAAGTYFGFGGPMQTLGYMDGYIDVV